MKARKISVMLLALLLTSGFVAACNGGSDSTQTASGTNNGSETDAPGSETDSGNTGETIVLDLGVWSDEEGKRLETAFANMESEIGISINVMKYASDSDFWDNIPSQIAAGTAPDLIASTNEHYLQYIREGLFTPLDDAIEDGTISLEGIDESALAAWQIDGHTYGVPYALNPGVFIINQNLWTELDLGEYPTTWDEVLEVSARYKELTGEPALCINIQEYHLTNYALSFGGGWGNGETINSEENAAALQFIIDAYREGYVITPSELGLGWDGAVMIQESALFSTGGAWYQASFASEAPDIELTYQAVPAGSDDNGLTLHSAALVELRNSDQSDAVKQAIGYAFANEDLFKATVEVTEVIPANSSYYDLYREELPELAQLIDYVEIGQPFAYPERSKEFADALIEQMQLALFDDSSTLTGQEIVETLGETFSN